MTKVVFVDDLDARREKIVDLIDVAKSDAEQWSSIWENEEVKPWPCDAHMFILHLKNFKRRIKGQNVSVPEPIVSAASSQDNLVVLYTGGMMKRQRDEPYNCIEVDGIQWQFSHWPQNICLIETPVISGSEIAWSRLGDFLGGRDRQHKSICDELNGRGYEYLLSLMILCDGFLISLRNRQDDACTLQQASEESRSYWDVFGEKNLCQSICREWQSADVHKSVKMLIDAIEKGHSVDEVLAEDAYSALNARIRQLTSGCRDA